MVYNYWNDLLLPKFGLEHLDGKSGSNSLLGSFMHCKPSMHFPQSKLVSGLKQLPQTSPSCFVPGAVMEKTDRIKNCE